MWGVKKDIEIYDPHTETFKAVRVEREVADYIEALEQSNRVLAFQKDTVSLAYLDQKGELEASLDFMHSIHEN